MFCKNDKSTFKLYVLSDFINLTQVHNFTVSAQDIFTFRRLSVFTVSFTGILQDATFCTSNGYDTDQKVVSSSPRVCLYFFYLYSIHLISFIIDASRPLRNEILDHSISKG